MAGNANSGQKINFCLSEATLADMINQYQQAVLDNKFGDTFMPQWDHFCAYLGLCRDDVQECYDKGMSGDNAYSKRAEMLKKHETWVFAQMFARCGKQTSMAIYLSKQKRLDGSRYSDMDLKGSNAPAKVVINFGGDDPRAKKASK